MTDEELDAMIAAEDHAWEMRERMQEAHATTAAALEDGDDYRTTFGAALSETHRRRARLQSIRDHHEAFRASFLDPTKRR